MHRKTDMTSDAKTCEDKELSSITDWDIFLFFTKCCGLLTFYPNCTSGSFPLVKDTTE